MRACPVLAILLGWASLAAAAGPTARPFSPTDIVEAEQNLLAGNHRFATAHMLHPDQAASRRVSISQAQHPIAAIVSCADSRVPPEVVFDQGLGSLFVVRTAGEVVDYPELASIEYAVEHLGVHLVIVLGHERCGAVQAALEAAGPGEGNLGRLVAAILPAIAGCKGHTPDETLDLAVKAEAEHVAGVISREDAILADRVKAGTLAIEVMRYDLDTGAVERLDSPVPLARLAAHHRH